MASRSNFPALRRCPGGFTLIELLVTVSVLVILATIAVPNIAGWIRASGVRAASSDLYASLIYARSEAVKRNGDVDVIPNDVTAWASGWSVQAGTTVLKRQDAYPSSIGIAGPAGNVTYRRDGRIAGTATVTFTVSAPSDSTIKSRSVSIDLSGRPSVVQ